ncbi:MAG: rod shape-determining protein RodA [Verrucomicrobiales bacterium]|nr:rod shape-determining protein RodA [Verrucomicrobiales bacterium]
MFETTLNQRESRIEWPMFAALFGLMILGALFIYSATSVNESAKQLAWYRQPHFKQIIFYGIGLGLAGGICLIDYRRIARWSLVIYWLTIVLLVAVLIPMIGTTHGWGARRWIDLGPFQMQPSELAKIGFIFALANFLSRPPEELRIPGLFLKALGMAVLPFLLILKEPDLGSALVLIPMTLALMFVAGAPAKYLRYLLGSAGIVVALLLIDILFAPPNWRLPIEQYQRERLLVYFGQDFAPRNATAAERRRAYIRQKDKANNVRQALISVGSGGLTGKGWRQGTQNALGYLPRAVAHNDFIFSVIAEEKGFLGSVAVLTCYTVILFTGIRIASQARDRLGKLLAVGIVTLFFSHVFINIGMNIRLMPVTGIPLPLLSYGGTSVLCSLVAAGILQNIHIYRRS